ncbi:VOC family protein [Aurantimonas sp. HBX-1]|uniref:VOC family protein n=1 Tax=Aurantimonas sp. HBX-1 TaxID=2906072 RepID=UPI001F45EBE3|nr:VOC family protein [Aurantimonas sp. HBX-1]UIJ72625.1 VOC family protein [Aurantimonas sp. HBX-1]
MGKTDPAILATMRPAHQGLRVPDREAAIAWYCDKLAMRVTRAFTLGPLTFTELEFASGGEFKLELASGGGEDDRPDGEGLMESFARHGWHHFALWVDDVDETVSVLRNRNVRITLDPTDNQDWKVRVAFFSDPWGNVTELLQPI